MTFSLRSSFAASCLVVGALTLIGCGQSRPSNTDILNSLNAALPVYVPCTITSVEPDFFPQSGGTLVIKGSAKGKTKEALYQPVDYGDQLKAMGFDPAQWQQALAAVNKLREPYKSTLMDQVPKESQTGSSPTMVKLGTPPGSDTDFEFSATGQKGDSGWLISDININQDASLTGQPLSQFAGALVQDSPEAKSQLQQVFEGRKKFIDAVKAAQAAIAAEDAKFRDMYQQATKSGQVYVGTFTNNRAETSPFGICITQQQTIGTSTVVNGYFFEPADQVRRKSFSGHLELNPEISQGHPIQIVSIANDGIDPGTMRPGTADGYFDKFNDLNAFLAVDSQGNLSGMSTVGTGGQYNLAPKH
jgi:hypothetical protein